MGALVKASHTLDHRFCVTKIRVAFRSNLINLDTPLIYFNGGNTRRNRPQFVTGIVERIKSHHVTSGKMLSNDNKSDM